MSAKGEGLLSAKGKRFYGTNRNFSCHRVLLVTLVSKRTAEEVDRL
jgi:hypothetical protein